MPEVGLDTRTKLCNLSSAFLLCTLTSARSVPGGRTAADVVSCFSSFHQLTLSCLETKSGKIQEIESLVPLVAPSLCSGRYSPGRSSAYGASVYIDACSSNLLSGKPRVMYLHVQSFIAIILLCHHKLQAQEQHCIRQITIVFISATHR